MPSLSKLLVVLSGAILACVDARVDISFYHFRYADCDTNRQGPNPACLGIGPDVCCSTKNNAHATSSRASLIVGLPGGARVGIYPYQHLSLRSCTGNVCKVSYGDNICISCNNDPRTGDGISLQGTRWAYIGGRKRDSANAGEAVVDDGELFGPCESTMEPNAMIVGDRYFRIGSGNGVPANITDEWWQMVASEQNWTYEDLPEHLLEFEDDTLRREKDTE